MKHDWTLDELNEHWTHAPNEMALLMNKYGVGRLGFAVLLKFFQAEGRFPANKDEVPLIVINYLAQQVGGESENWIDYDWHGRTIKNHRAEIRALWNFREASVEDGDALVVWLCSEILRRERQLHRLKEASLGRFRELKIEPPTPDRLDRLISSAIRTFEDEFSTRLSERLSPETSAQLDSLLELQSPEVARGPLHNLRADPGSASIETLEQELENWPYWKISNFQEICSRVFLRQSFRRTADVLPWKRYMN